jgi:hypothetical protein
MCANALFLYIAVFGGDVCYIRENAAVRRLCKLQLRLHFVIMASEQQNIQTAHVRNYHQRELEIRFRPYH